MKRLFPGVLLSAMLCALCVSAAVAGDAPDQGIDADALSRHVRILASDEFEGRAPVTPGEDKTVAYLIDALTKAGEIGRAHV